MQEMCCPACKTMLTPKQAIEILNGSGFVCKVKVRLPSGEICYVPAGCVNPNEVEVLD